MTNSSVLPEHIHLELWRLQHHMFLSGPHTMRNARMILNIFYVRDGAQDFWIITPSHVDTYKLTDKLEVNSS